MHSFGHAAYFGLGAYGAALLFKALGLPMEIAMLLAPLLAGVGALVVGWFSVRLSGVYLAMLTLAFAQITWAVVFQWDTLTGGDGADTFVLRSYQLWADADLITDLGNITSATIVMRKDNAGGTYLLQKTVDIADFDNTGLTHAEWLADTSQHFSWELTADETNQTMPTGKLELAVYIAIQWDRTSGGPVLMGSTIGKIFEDGLGTAGTPEATDPTYYTAAQTDARYGAFVTAPATGNDFTMLPGAVAPTSGKYQAFDANNHYTIYAGETNWRATPRATF
jgi:hypothetical protein